MNFETTTEKLEYIYAKLSKVSDSELDKIITLIGGDERNDGLTSKEHRKLMLKSLRNAYKK